MWQPLRSKLAAIPGPFSFLDVGGGNGVFTDRVLAEFPDATGVVGDDADLLLRRHRKHPRKTTVKLDALRLPAAGLGRFDVVFMNWLLHHLVDNGSYRRTRQHITRALADTRWLLNPGGHLSVFENMYDGALHHNLPSRLVFALTSSRGLAPLTRRLGANTAGVGVCFQSERAWRDLVAGAGYQVVSFTPDERWPMSAAKRALLGLRAVRVGHLWLEPIG